MILFFMWFEKGKITAIFCQNINEFCISKRLWVYGVSFIV